MDKEELSEKLKEKEIQKSALEDTLSNLKKDFDDGKIGDEFYYKRRTSLSASIKTLEKEIQEFKKQSEGTPAQPRRGVRTRGRETSDRSVRIGRGATVGGDIVTGEKVTKEGGVTIRGEKIDIHGDIAGRDIIKGAEVFGKPEGEPSKETDYKSISFAEKEKLKKDFLQNKLSIHHQNLRNLELQKAKYGSLNVPVHILTQIDEEEKEIAEIRRKLK